MRNKPKYIPAPNVRLEDVIRVTYRADKGVMVSKIGTVASRAYEGSDRVYYTREGGELLRWNPSHKPPLVTLIKAAQMTDDTLDWGD